MTICTRCRGNVLEAYDEHISAWYNYCLQCGDRPHITVYRKDGLPRDAPPKCQQGCGRPCMAVTGFRSRAVQYLTKCDVCRAKQQNRRQAKKRERKKKEAV
ncbi:MAG: hypothetical protein OEY77_00025 [Nitrospira sp.]|nr:hypothetical protein [Nitrospira sp.]